MAVSKELLARYKELKAQGINVTLSELKAQMEAEGANNNNESQTSKPETGGFSTLSSSTPQSSEPIQSNGSQVQEPSWSTSYYSQNEEIIEKPVESYSSSFEVASSSMIQSNSMENYSSSTSIYQEPLQTAETHTTENQQPYIGNVVQNTTIDTNSYNNNFNANFSWEQKAPQVSPETEEIKPKYTGNVPPQPASSFFGPAVVDNTTQTAEPLRNGKYCLIGYPLGHSLSEYIHNAGFESLGINTSYEILETPPDDLVDRIKYLKYNGYAGFNVTIPLKLPVTVFLDYIDSSADVVGAVNTVVINSDKTLKGYNTDIIGFRNAIPNDFTLAGKVAGVLGTGGAARAAITALAQAQVKQIKIYTRNIPNCAELMNFLRKKFPFVEFNVYQIEYIRDLSDVQILINTTPIGMQGRSADMTPVEENELKTLPQGALVYDVIYNPKKTLLLKLAQKLGYRTINGIDMFIHQAVAAEQIWTGKTPDFKDMKIAALENL